MKLTLDRTAALAAVSRVHAVVDGKGTIPILANVLLAATKDGLELAGTDLDIVVRCGAEARVEQIGATTVPGKRLHEILKAFPPGAEVGFEIVDNRLVVSAGRSRFKLSMLPAGDFPVMDIGQGIRGEVRAKELGRLLQLASYSISTDASRYYLNGVYLHAVDVAGAPFLRAVSTDGHRLARIETPAPEELAELQGVIIPRKTVGEVLRLVDGPPDAMVEFVRDGSKISFSAHGVEIVSKTIDGSFPDYGRLIPAAPPNGLSGDVALMSNAVKRVAIVSAGEKARYMRVALEPGRVTFRARDITDGSEAVEEVEIDYDGPAVEASFNAAYLVDVLAQMSGRTVRAEFAGPTDQWKFLDPVDPASTHILMPLRV